jgi:hypothetical protein
MSLLDGRPTISTPRDTHEHPSSRRTGSLPVRVRRTLLTVVAHTPGMPTDPRTGRSVPQPTVRTGFGFFFGVA